MTSSCDAVEKFTRKSRDARPKSFLNSDLDVFKAFQLLLRHVNTKMMHKLDVLTAKVWSKKTRQGNNLAELRWNVYLKDLKKKDI